MDFDKRSNDKIKETRKMTSHWRMNPYKFVIRMNLLPKYQEAKTSLESWDKATKEGVISVMNKTTKAKFTVGTRYDKEERSLVFFPQDKPEVRLEFWRLMCHITQTGEVPELKPHIPPAIQALMDKVEEPCPAIHLTKLEWDVLINGILHNPDNENKEPWKEGTITLSSHSIVEHSPVTRKSIPSIMASLVKKGLIECTGKETERKCSVTHIGALVIRREMTGA